MKQVKLVEFRTRQLAVEDARNVMEYHSHEDLPPQIKNSQEFVMDEVETYVAPIERIVDHGVTHYMAVDRKVWEYMYLMQNPVTAKTQEKHIASLREDLLKVRGALRHSQYMFRTSMKTASNATFITRLLWLFTGVKL